MAEKRIVIIAGPNGVGKTTFALEFLSWSLYDNSGRAPVLLDWGEKK